MARLVLHLDRDDAVGITRVPLLDPWRLTLKAGDGDRLEVVHRVQRRHKREIDLVLWREIAGRGTRVRDLAAFEIAKMADVVRRLISACTREGRLARGR